jgi:hypothetical protein
MILTTGIVALAGIAGTASAPVATALTSFGDRKHERKQKFEKRAWEDKKPALVDIIKKVSDIRRACEPDSSWKRQGIGEAVQFSRMRVRALRVYHDNRFEFIPAALLAFGSKSVCDLAEELEGVFKEHYTVATTVNLNQLARYKKESIEQDNPDDALRLYRQAQDMEDELGNWPEDLNVHEFRALCDRVLKAAKEDLSGK